MLDPDIDAIGRPGEDPFSLFEAWMEKARGSEPNDPNAMALATCDGEGVPNVRMVLLKEASPTGFVFYTNLESSKGREILSVPRAALCFHWKSLRRQIRVRGGIAAVDGSEADAYFASRARQSQIGAWASRQSRPLPGRLTLEKEIAARVAQFGLRRDPAPGALVGFPSRAAGDRVLARSAVSPARSSPISPRRCSLGLVHRNPVSLDEAREVRPDGADPVVDSKKSAPPRLGRHRSTPPVGADCGITNGGRKFAGIGLAQGGDEFEPCSRPWNHLEQPVANRSLQFSTISQNLVYHAYPLLCARRRLSSPIESAESSSAVPGPLRYCLRCSGYLHNGICSPRKKGASVIRCNSIDSLPIRVGTRSKVKFRLK